jgi:hypothetical protein
MFVEFLEGTDGAVCALRGRLQIEPSWSARWETLSHGERRRVQRRWRTVRALLRVSHDLRFLRRVTEIWWRIEPTAGPADTIIRVTPFEGPAGGG